MRLFYFKKNDEDVLQIAKEDHSTPIPSLFSTRTHQIKVEITPCSRLLYAITPPCVLQGWHMNILARLCGHLYYYDVMVSFLEVDFYLFHQTQKMESIPLLQSLCQSNVVFFIFGDY